MRIHYQWPCPFCDKVLESRKQFQKHKRDNHYKLKITNTYINVCYCHYCNKKFNYLSAKTNHEKYCKSNPNHIEYRKGFTIPDEVRQKISNTAKKNKRSGGYRQGAGFKNIKKGFYKGIWCDSSWELAFLIYCLDHSIAIKRNIDKFPYYIENDIHYYIPDFIIGNTYIEIKGRVDDRCKYKFEQFPKDKHLKVHYSDNMKCFLNYVYQKYGKNFTDLYEGKTYIKKEKKIKQYEGKTYIKKEKKIKHDCKCKYCNETFDTRQKLYEHLKICEEKIKLKINEKLEKYKIYVNQCELNGILKDISGKYNYSKYKEEIWIERKEKILNCGIDLMKFGWISKVIEKTNFTRRIIGDTLEHFKDEFKGKYFRRKLPAGITQN